MKPGRSTWLILNGLLIAAAPVAGSWVGQLMVKSYGRGGVGELLAWSMLLLIITIPVGAMVVVKGIVARMVERAERELRASAAYNGKGVVPTGDERMDVKKELAPSGKLRVGLNYGNFLLVLKDSADGSPNGIAPDLGRELGRRLGVPVEFVKFPEAGQLADGVRDDKCDVGFLGAEPQRANEIAFTKAYLEIPVTFLVPPGSKIKSIAEVDQKGVRIAVSDRSAYDLYLSRNLKNATLVRAKGIEGSYQAYLNDKLEVLAGLKPRLVSDAEKVPGSRVLDGQVTGVQQACGTTKKRVAGARYLSEFIEDVKRSGLVAKTIDKHGVRGVSVAP